MAEAEGSRTSKVVSCPARAVRHTRGAALDLRPAVSGLTDRTARETSAYHETMTVTGELRRASQVRAIKSTAVIKTKTSVSSLPKIT